MCQPAQINLRNNNKDHRMVVELKSLQRSNKILRVKLIKYSYLKFKFSILLVQFKFLNNKDKQLGHGNRG